MKKKCICGCGQTLESDHMNFATPACVLRAMLVNAEFVKQFGRKNIEDAIAIADQIKRSKDKE